MGIRSVGESIARYVACSLTPNCFDAAQKQSKPYQSILS
jgi:hypothetical protein